MVVNINKMQNITVNKFNRMPLVDVTENKLYLVEQNIHEKDDLEMFITTSTSEYVKTEPTKELYIGFIYNKSDTISSFNSNEPVYTSITCFDGDNNNTILITEIDKNKYKYKNFTLDPCIHLINFKQNIQIKMPDYSHVILGNKCTYLHIYIYNQKPDAELYISENKNKFKLDFDYVNLTNHRIIYDGENISFAFFNELLYLRRNTFDFINHIMECNTDNLFSITLKSNINIDNNPKKMMDDSDNIVQDTRSKYNRFINRHKITNILHPDTCEYILLYSKPHLDIIAENNNKYNNYIDLSKTQEIKELVLFYVHRKIINNVNELYNIPADDYLVNPNFITITILSPEDLKQRNNVNLQIGTITIDIMLSHNNCKSHNFNDSTYTSLSIGDAIIYNNNTIKNFSNNNKEDVYLLSIFVDIISMQRMTSRFF